jgi:hypothetical protein
MAAALKTYRVKTNFKHDGEDYVDGDDVDLTKAQAEQALESGAIAQIETPKAPKAAPAAK